MFVPLWKQELESTIRQALNSGVSPSEFYKEVCRYWDYSLDDLRKHHEYEFKEIKKTSS